MIKKHTFKGNERADHLNISCHFWRGQKLLPHFHDDYYEIIIMTDGEMDSVVNESIIHQKRKDVAIVRPKTPHGFDCLRESEHFNIAVSCDRFERLLAGKDSVKNALSKYDYFTMSLSNAEFDYVSECISHIDEKCAMPLSVNYAETVISVIFLSIMSQQNSEEFSEYSVGYYCRDAMFKIENGDVSFKTAGDIYEFYPVSHTSFISEFKAITGKTPSEYLRDSKIDRAKDLLLNTSRSVLDISYDVGYDSMSHFIKCFKFKYGITPLQFRKAGGKYEMKEDNNE